MLAQDPGWEKNAEVGSKARERGDYAEAERLLRLALAQVERLGKNDWRAAQVLDDLAQVLISRAKFGEAESFAKRSLTIREAAYGRDDLAVSSSLDTLAEVYEEQGKNTEAEAASPARPGHR